MNLIVTADIHLSIKQGIPEKWQVNRYLELFRFLASNCLSANATLIIAGDLLDKAKPSLKEIKLLFDCLDILEKNKITTFVVSGNHCTLAKSLNVYDFLPVKKYDYIEFGKEEWIPKVGHMVYFLDHDKLHDSEFDLNRGLTNILVTHFRCSISDYIKEEIDVKTLTKDFDLVLAGDIHFDLSFDNVHYANQPINSQFEKAPNTGYLLVTLEKDSFSVTRIATNFPSQIILECEAKKFTELELEDKHFYKIVVTGEDFDLKKIPDKLDNAVVVKRLAYNGVAPEKSFESSEETLIEQEVDLEDDLVMYMRDNLKLPLDTIKGMIGVWESR